MNDCGHYQQFFQGKPLPCAECSKTSWHRVYDRESGAGPVSFRPQTTALPTTRPQLDIVTFDRREVRADAKVWVREGAADGSLSAKIAARNALRHALGEPTRDEFELRQVLGDAALESAMVQRFGERLRGCLSGQGIQCMCGLVNGEHWSWCKIAALLRDMLGPEETQRQVNASHDIALATMVLRRGLRREHLGVFPGSATATEILLREEELLSQAGLMSAAERARIDALNLAYPEAGSIGLAGVPERVALPDVTFRTAEQMRRPVLLPDLSSGPDVTDD